MLQSLHVKNMALIQEEEVSFGEGLNILTGETGAGKSIIIGSVNVALGTGSFKDYVPEGAQYALVELSFTTENRNVLHKMEEQEIPVEDGQIIISRKYQNGRSISRVNGETVNLSFVRELAADLIDIHGQHQHQSLLYSRNHLLILDEFAREDLGQRREVCERACQEYRQICGRLQKAQEEGADRAKQIDFLNYEIEEIREAGLRIGEDEELERDYTRMSHGQKIMEALCETQRLTEGENGAGEQIDRALRSLGSVTQYDEGLEELHQELMQMEDLMNDFSRSLSGYLDDFSYDEEQFDQITKRLDLINHLKSKYGRTIEDILEYQKEKQEKLNQLTDYEAYLEALKQKKEECRKTFFAVAEEISKIRKTHARLLEKQIETSLIELNFLDVQFSIDFQRLKEPGVLGWDEVCFMISTNPGMPLRPLQEVASGGELSRIMLAIKSVMAERDAIGTLIFDEIDTGISGRTAQKVSEKMAVIARAHQVICITHLAQIAAMADQHLAIEKRAENGKTSTLVRSLDPEESIEELARILGGVEITQAVYENAREMKELAERTKKY
ncbi:MAG: DNA repair protein RecN [Lachnospiraceae bacterium]|nr:DNA repair protein RecN [Lachnospiraceae bacterium]